MTQPKKQNTKKQDQSEKAGNVAEGIKELSDNELQDITGGITKNMRKFHSECCVQRVLQATAPPASKSDRVV